MDCEWEIGEFPTCLKCEQGYLPDENFEVCLTDEEALALSAVVDSYGVYRYCDKDCVDCRLIDNHPVCYACKPGQFLFEDGTCISSCTWDEHNFRYIEFAYLDENNNEVVECINEFNCPEGYGVDWANNEC